MKPFRCHPLVLGAFISICFIGRIFGETILPEATNLWMLKLPTPVSGSAPAIATDGTIYQGTFDGTLFAVTPQGEIKWQFKAGREIKSTPAIADDGTIYFGARDRKCYAVTPDGKLKWTFATGAWVDSSPAIAADGTVYFGSWDKTFYALNPDGSKKWSVVIGAIIDSSPAIAADGTIYFGAHDKKFYALTADGKTRWTFATGGEIISSPAIGADGTVYFTSTDGNLYALKPDGTEQWHYHTGGFTESSPIVDEMGNIAVGVNNHFYLMDPAGKERWHWTTPCLLDVSLVAATGRVYCSFPWRKIRAFIPDTNPMRPPVWQADMRDNVYASLVLGSDGIIYCSGEWELYAIRPPGEARPPAKSSWPMFHANARHTGRVTPVQP